MAKIKNNIVPFLQSPILTRRRSPTATSSELVPFISQSVATKSGIRIRCSSSPRTLTKRPLCFTSSSSDSEKEEQAERVSKKRKQLSVANNSSSSSIQPSNVRENIDDDIIPSTSFALRTTPSFTRSSLHKSSPSKDLKEFLQILGDQRTNNKVQQVLQFLQSHPSVAKVLAVYEPQSAKNVPSKNFTSDVLSTDGAISSTRLPQSPQKSSNTVPLIRVPSATISPEIFEESKITTQNYETRGTFICWRDY